MENLEAFAEALRYAVVIGMLLMPFFVDFEKGSQEN